MLNSWRRLILIGIGTVLFLGSVRSSFAADRQLLRGHVPKAVSRLQPQGLLPGTNHLNLAIGLSLRDLQGLDELIRQQYDPASTNFHKFITPEEFTARFGPPEADYQAVIRFAETNGLTVVSSNHNGVVLDVAGGAASIERAFQLILRTYRHPTEARDFFAPDTEPSVPAGLPVVDVQGLSDFGRPRPMSRKAHFSSVRPLSFSGSGPNNEYAGNDFRNAYAPGTTLTGSGQTVGLFQADGYYMNDITNYENVVGKINGSTNYVPLTNVLIDNFNGIATTNETQVNEVTLDIEMAIAMAPGLSRVIVYEGNPTNGYFNPNDILQRMANDNLARQLSSSWSWSGGPSASTDTILKQMISQGQSFFQASGDSDAYTGANALDSHSSVTVPVDSTNLTCVGGATLTMSGSSWSSETVWNYSSSGNEGSSGGISTYYKIPPWQKGVSMASNSGSTTWRNIPDVALTADNIFMSNDNGDYSGTYYSMGTSCAAPLWAGFCALVNQLSIASNGTPVGFLNPALYAVGTNAIYYTNCFHDITTGNNIGANTAGYFYATNGYDLCTGLGTPAGTNLINALALPQPRCLTQPTNQTVAVGGKAAFSVTVGGLPPFTYRWLVNGTNLSAAATNISGITNSTLTITNVTTTNAGNYTVVITNLYGRVTSSVATLTLNLTAPTLTLVSSLNPSGYKAGVSFTTSLTPSSATGTVQFLTNGVLFNTQTLSSGAATSASLTTLSRGTNSIAARYSGNANYQPATNTFLQIVTNHPPVTAAFYTNRYTGLSLKIPLSVLTNNWSDADGDVLSLAGIGISTNGVTVTNSAGTLVYYNSNNVADLFACTVSDGWGGTNFQNVYIAVVALPTNAIPAISSVARGTNGTFSINLAGMSGLTYVLQAKTNLISSGAWLPLATNVPDTNGVWNFSEPATNHQRFYRLMLVP
jgi:subtilase family serine protease